MAIDLFQGSQLDPNVSTGQTQQTAPEFYTNYLQDITNLGANAVAKVELLDLAHFKFKQ